jgi:hypothetical protein
MQRGGACLVALVWAGCAGAPAPGGADLATGGPATIDLAAPDGDLGAGDLGAADQAAGGGDLAPSGFLLPPLTACTPSGDACQPGPAVTTLFASYRKDAWLTQYGEDTPEPKDGGRLHVAAVAAAGGAVTRVLVDGVDVATIEQANPATPPPFEWAHVWPAAAQAGAPIWVAFHSRDKRWDQKTSATLRIETSQGVAVDGTFPVAATKVPLTYVTTSEDRTTFLIHLQNRDAAPRTVARLLLDGRDVSGLACAAGRRLAPGETALLSVATCAPAEPGRAFTVVVEYQDAVTAVGVGRVVRPFFPVEAWNNTGECPFPSGKAKNHQAFLQAGIDTQYLHGGVCNACGCDAFTLLDQELPQNGLRALVTDDVMTALASRVFQTLEGVAGIATGDESDGSIYDETSGVPVAAIKARKSREAWARYPGLPTFNGGKTNRNIGTFAGMADVQGLDVYIGACAPHIAPTPGFPPPRAPHDYLRNTRENHMPLPTWLYAQGLSPAWNKTQPVTNAKIHVQPDPQEILVQAMQVLTAGGKGFLWFQANQDEANRAPARWQAIVASSRMVRGVRHLVREGDPTGRARTSGKALVEAIRAREAIVVPMVALEPSSSVDDSCFATVFLGESSVPHWVFAAQTFDVSVDVPDDLGIADAFEVTPTAVVNLAQPPTVAGRTLTLGSVRVDNTTPVRLYVLARDAAVRARVAAALK